MFIGGKKIRNQINKIKKKLLKYYQLRDVYLSKPNGTIFGGQKIPLLSVIYSLCVIN